MRIFIALLLLLAGCASDSGGNRPAPTPNWQFFYSSGTSGTCANFDFPNAPGSVHYCAKQMNVALGQTLTATFTVSGSGTLEPSEVGEVPPATISLFLWRRGDPMTGVGQYAQYRYWSAKATLINSTTTMRVVLQPENWISIYGPADPAAFQAALNDLQGVGFTLSGGYFAGHGVRAIGQVHFTLDSFSAGYGHKRKHGR